ncbi:MAG: peptide-methionine (S)-S-oxide reductase [Gammaproteobacteria bacterium]|nr:MAG: peptide-methionine (S)-S-oxide reductase [Gammaproteobacteria bacterium]
MVVFNYRSHRASLTWLLLLAVFSLPCASAAEPSEAIFAGGCFWCMEPPFDALDGVIETVSGYTGGHVTKPTYKEVSSGKTGHTEAILITYDPEKVSYQQLLEIFWRNIDPLDEGGQFCDRGSQYRSEIFTLNQEQDELARASKDKLDTSGLLNRPVATAISSASTFYPAEGYHQNYYQTNPVRYKYYKWNCGRQQRLDEIWKTDPQPPA